MADRTEETGIRIRRTTLARMRARIAALEVMEERGRIDLGPMEDDPINPKTQRIGLDALINLLLDREDDHKVIKRRSAQRRRAKGGQ